MKIGLYFGSFNPIHLGHLKLAGYLIDNQLVDEVWFVISPCNPFKSQSNLLDEYIRLDMLMLAIQNQPQFKVSDVEFTMPVPSYTIDTLHEITKQLPDNQYNIIIGSDNALVFDQWKNYLQILNEFPVFVYPRKGFDFIKVASLYPQMQLLNTPFFDISSSQIREFIVQKKDVSLWLHPSVNQYIIENNLYK